jgi:hypothetical protein
MGWQWRTDRLRPGIAVIIRHAALQAMVTAPSGVIAASLSVEKRIALAPAAASGRTPALSREEAAKKAFPA